MKRELGLYVFAVYDGLSGMSPVVQAFETLLLALFGVGLGGVALSRTYVTGAGFEQHFKIQDMSPQFPAPGTLPLLHHH